MKQCYRVKNWKDYNRDLIQRGNLTIWIEEGLQNWYEPIDPLKRGRPRIYSDAAVECMSMLRLLFELPLRMTQGLTMSLLEKMGLSWSVPNYTTLSRRLKKLKRTLFADGKKRHPAHILIDSTGLKVYGEGEWKVRQHGVGKRRTWRRFHLVIDAKSLEILAEEITDRDTVDPVMLPALVSRLGKSVKKLSGDGAFDGLPCRKFLADKKIIAIVPPPANAKTRDGPETALRRRNRDIRFIRQHGINAWKKKVKYHRRSLIETTMCRQKIILGEKLHSRNFDNQKVEGTLRCKILNTITRLGMPQSYLVA